MSEKSERLRIGILGCGPIAQMAHFDACRKSRNAELYAICDTAEDLLSKMAAVRSPLATYLKYEPIISLL